MQFRYSLGMDVRGGDVVTFTMVNGLRHTITIPMSYRPGMTIDSDIEIRSHVVLQRAQQERVDEDVEDVDFNDDEGLAGKW